VLEPVALSFAGDAKVGDQPQHVSVLLKDEAQISRAKPRRRFGQRSEHRLQIERGVADDPEHICSGGLLLQRLGEFARALLLRLKQPRVFDRDYRVIGECLHQLDLLAGERTYGCALQEKYANRNPLSQERYAEHGTKITHSRQFTVLVFRNSKNIRNVNGFALEQNPASYATAIRSKCLTPH